MAQSMINIRMDTDEKNSFEDVCDQLGLTITVAFKMFAKKVFVSVEFLSTLLLIHFTAIQTFIISKRSPAKLTAEKHSLKNISWQRCSL